MFKENREISVTPTKTIDCPGDGRCLIQTDFDNVYEQSDCSHNCTPVKCVNYKMCKMELPEWVAYKRIQIPICINCDISFAGPLQFVEKVDECSICLNNVGMFIKFQQCTHEVCCSCFSKCCGWNIDEYQSDNDDDANRLEYCPFCRTPHLNHW